MYVCCALLVSQAGSFAQLPTMHHDTLFVAATNPPSPLSSAPMQCWVVESFQLRTCVRDDRKCLQGDD